MCNFKKISIISAVVLAFVFYFGFSSPTNSVASLASPTGLSATLGQNQSGALLRPTFNWNAVAGANGYRVRLCTVWDCTSGVVLDTSSETPVGVPYTPSTSFSLSSSTTYYWQVKAFDQNSFQWSDWSYVNSFATSASSVTITAPTGLSVSLGANQSGALLRPTFSWSPVNGAEGYRVQLCTISDCTFGIILDTSSSTPVSVPYTPSTSFSLSYNTAYYWQVKAFDQNSFQWSDWSAVSSLATTPPPSATISDLKFYTAGTRNEVTESRLTAPSADPGYYYYLLAAGDTYEAGNSYDFEVTGTGLDGLTIGMVNAPLTFSGVATTSTKISGRITFSAGAQNGVYSFMVGRTPPGEYDKIFYVKVRGVPQKQILVTGDLYPNGYYNGGNVYYNVYGGGIVSLSPDAGQNFEGNLKADAVIAPEVVGLRINQSKDWRIEILGSENDKAYTITVSGGQIKIHATGGILYPTGTRAHIYTYDNQSILIKSKADPNLSVSVQVDVSPQRPKQPTCGTGTVWNENLQKCQSTIPTVTISAKPASGVLGSVQSQLAWTSTNALSCVASGDWSGGKETNGFENVGFTEAKTYTYTITCTGNKPSDTKSASATVTVSAPPQNPNAPGPMTITKVVMYDVSKSYASFPPPGVPPISGINIWRPGQYMTQLEGTGMKQGTQMFFEKKNASGQFEAFNPAGLDHGSWVAGTSNNVFATNNYAQGDYLGYLKNGSIESNKLPFFIVIPGIDLTAGSATPTTAVVNTAQTYTATISNIGSLSTGSSFSYFFQKATLPDGGGTITDLASSTMSALAAGASAVATSPTITFSSAGTPSVRVCADKSNSASAGTISETNENNNCGPWATITVGTQAVMSGTLTPATSSCVIASGANTCNINFSWTTTNPVGVSAVTKPINVTVATGNSGANTPFSIKYNSETFYLYNNAVLLDQKTAASSCASGTGWDGSKCAPVPIDGVCASAHYSCVVGTSSNNSSGSSSWTWRCSGVNGGAVASCSQSKSGGGTCSNGATNPPLCTTGTGGICLNGATNPPYCTVNTGGTCVNGATNPPACTISGGTCINGATNPPACTVNAGGTCVNGATNPTLCTVIGNPPVCVNGAINQPTCNQFRINPIYNEN